MKHHLSLLLLLLSTAVSTPAWALFDVQVLTGKRKTEFKGSTSSGEESGNELKLAAHLDPIPLVPIGFGLSLAQVSYEDVAGFDEITGTEVGLEVQAWFPLELFGLVPYAKVGYTLTGAYDAKFSSSTLPGGLQPRVLYQPSGLYLAAGLRWEFLLRLGVMLELEQSTRKLEFDKFEDLGGLTLAKENLDANSTSILFGVQAGI